MISTEKFVVLKCVMGKWQFLLKHTNRFFITVELSIVFFFFSCNDIVITLSNYIFLFITFTWVLDLLSCNFS